MLVKLRLKDGRELTVGAAEVVILDDFQQPLAITYVENGLIAHTDATKTDFSKTARRLGYGVPAVEVICTERA